GAGTDRAFGDAAAAGIFAGGDACGCIRVSFGAADGQIVQTGSADDRDARVTDVQADSARTQMAHHPIACGEAEDAAAGEQHTVDETRIEARARPEDVGLTRAWRTAADAHAADGALWTQHDRAAGCAAALVVIADKNAERVRDGACGCPMPSPRAHRMPSFARWSAVLATMPSRPNGAR